MNSLIYEIHIFLSNSSFFLFYSIIQNCYFMCVIFSHKF
nr:MAG TPA: hypothetical protein [Caudoviricetes sp.]